MVEGFKCFDKGLINRYGTKFEIGVSYHANGNIQFGNRGNGFHMCKNMEDTFRYFDADTKEVDVCSCIGWGNIHKIDDEYYGYYDMYSCEYIKLIKLYKRKEIIEHMLKQSDRQVARFISLYKLTIDEIREIEDLYKDNDKIIRTINYYQRKNSSY